MAAPGVGLHSATMVKAGVFLLARFWPVLAGTDAWFWIIGGAGLITLVLGAYAAIFQQDMKGVLAYSTISHLGLITLLLGLNSSLALVAAIFHMVNHATFKASLFMAAGIVDHETGTRTRPGPAVRPVQGHADHGHAGHGGGRVHGGRAAAQQLHLERDVLRRDHLRQRRLDHARRAAAGGRVAGAFSVAYSLRFILQVFFGPPATDLPRAPHEPPRWMLFPSALLVFMCLLVGVFPAYTVGPFLATAAQSILGADMPEYQPGRLAWREPAAGHERGRHDGGRGAVPGAARAPAGNPGRVPFIYRFDGRRSFRDAAGRLQRGGVLAAALAGVPRLQVQMLLIVLGTLFVAWLPLRAGGWLDGAGHLTTVDPAFALLWLVGGVCAVAAARPSITGWPRWRWRAARAWSPA